MKRANLAVRPLHKNMLKDGLRNSLGRACHLVGERPKRFVIFSSGRAGSNLLVALLKQHPDIWVHAEIFGEYQLEDHGVRRRINRLGPVEYMQNAFRPMGREKAVGLKLLYHQLGARYGEKRGVRGLNRVREALQEDDEILYIHLRRRDLFSLLVSSRLAAMTQSWEGKRYALDKVTIDVTWAEERLENYEREVRAHRSWLPEDRVLDMYYEDLVTDSAAEAARVSDLLGVRHVELEIATRKQTVKPHRDYVRNLDEVQRHFRGSKYERYFCDG